MVFIFADKKWRTHILRSIHTLIHWIKREQFKFEV